MSDIPSFTKLVPGFDFLQSLAKNAGSALPSMGQWVAPTLDPEELQKRIDELKTVQFWLEQNARMLGTTIQALEVQRMTLSTLKTMNVQMTDLRDAMKIPATAAAPMASPFSADSLMQVAKTAMDGLGAMGKAAAAAAPPVEEPAAAAPVDDRERAAAAQAQPSDPKPGVVDPMQWWGALTKQFTQLAASAISESTTDAAKNLAGAMMKNGLEAMTPKKTPAKAKSSRPAARKPAAAKKAAKPAGAAKPAKPAVAKRVADRAATVAAALNDSGIKTGAR